MGVQTKLRAGKYKVPATLIYSGDRIYIKVRFNRTLKDEVKSMEGAKWHGFEDPPRKLWSVKNSQRNQFQLDYLQGKNPYARYDKPLIDIEGSTRPLYTHQKEMIAQALTRQYCIFACEMGTGKSLSAIEVLERIPGLQNHEAWYIGPRNGVKAVALELIKWFSKVQPKMLTYEQLVKVMNDWEEGNPAPRVAIFDESSKVKNPTSQRSQAARHLADSIREEWGDSGYVIEMSGTPAPKSPVDWWNQSEVACPGFLKEGDHHKLKKRLSIIEQRESVAGGSYPHLITWLDDENKCNICGQYRDARSHQMFEGMVDSNYHEFQPSKNEVEYLYKRLKGLVLIKFKSECTDLPEKQYRVIHLKPDAETLRVAKTISKTADRTIEALNLNRQLSDGFQYTEEAGDLITCGACNGTGETHGYIYVGEGDPTDANYDIGEIDRKDWEYQKITCDSCGGIGETRQYKRGAEEVHTPKDDCVIEILEEHEDIGRIVLWAGFTASVDKLVKLCIKQGWHVLRVDGRGYAGLTPDNNVTDSDDLLKAMDASHPNQQYYKSQYPKLAFIGHPKAGGYAVTLTASPTEVFYSNSFDGEARFQAEDRGHRPGMDKNKGLTIIDLFHLPTDQLVYENLVKKRNLQNLTLGEVQEVMETTESTRAI